MIPPRADLETLVYWPSGRQCFTTQELDILEDLAGDLVDVADKLRNDLGRQFLRHLWPDEFELISKTHFLTTKRPGTITLFEPNYAQKKFYQDVIVAAREDERPIRGIVLKARQLGFSTLIQSWQFEQCDREHHRRAMTVSFDEESTQAMFNKAQFIRAQQWFPRPAPRDARDRLEFDNGSVFYTQTAGSPHAGRSLTFHNLHCSELPLWTAPEETLASLLQSVPVQNDTSIFFESTAKGAVGEFYDAWKAAESGRSDFVPFFAPWYWDPDYRLAFPSDDHRQLFGRTMDVAERRLIERHQLELEQLHWRRYKIKNELQGSEAKFRQEFPSTAAEAFLTSGAPVFNPDAIAELEHNAIGPLWTGNIHMEIPA